MGGHPLLCASWLSPLAQSQVGEGAAPRTVESKSGIGNGGKWRTGHCISDIALYGIVFCETVRSLFTAARYYDDHENSSYVLRLLRLPSHRFPPGPPWTAMDFSFEKMDRPEIVDLQNDFLSDATGHAVWTVCVYSQELVGLPSCQSTLCISGFPGVKGTLLRRSPSNFIGCGMDSVAYKKIRNEELGMRNGV